MGAAIVLGVVFVFLVVILAGLLRGLDWDALRRDPGGPLSIAGVRGIVGGGFLVGLAYGLLVGGQSGAETWRWLSRGVVDGLVVACAGAFYIGYQQRKRARSEARVRDGASGVDGPLDEGADSLRQDPPVSPPGAAPPPSVTSADVTAMPDRGGPPAAGDAGDSPDRQDSQSAGDPEDSRAGAALDTEGGGSAAPPEAPVERRDR